MLGSNDSIVSKETGGKSFVEGKDRSFSSFFWLAAVKGSKNVLVMTSFEKWALFSRLFHFFCIMLEYSVLVLVSRPNLGRLLEGEEDGVPLEENGEPKSQVSTVGGGVEVDSSSLGERSEDKRSM